MQEARSFAAPLALVLSNFQQADFPLAAGCSVIFIGRVEQCRSGKIFLERLDIELPLWVAHGVRSWARGGVILAALCQTQALSCLPPLLTVEKNTERRRPPAHAILDHESSEDAGHEIHLPSSQQSFDRDLPWLKGKVFCNFSSTCPSFLFIKFRYLKKLRPRSLPVKMNGWVRGGKHPFNAQVGTSWRPLMSFPFLAVYLGISMHFCWWYYM